VLIALGMAFGAAPFGARAAAPATPQGYINYRTYAGDQRSAIRSRTAVPDGSFYPERAEGPYNGIPLPDAGDDDTPPLDNVRDNYNMELIGYFYPPRTGKIQFAIASDDPGELWLSTDDTPANKERLATLPTRNASQLNRNGTRFATLLVPGMEVPPLAERLLPPVTRPFPAPKTGRRSLMSRRASPTLFRPLPRNLAEAII
jgi:hypothetical protein